MIYAMPKRGRETRPGKGKGPGDKGPGMRPWNPLPVRLGQPFREARRPSDAAVQARPAQNSVRGWPVRVRGGGPVPVATLERGIPVAAIQGRGAGEGMAA